MDPKLIYCLFGVGMLAVVAVVGPLMSLMVRRARKRLDDLDHDD